MKRIFLPFAALCLTACNPGRIADKAIEQARNAIDTTEFVHRQFAPAAFHTLAFDGFGELRFVQGQDSTVRVDVAAHPDYIDSISAQTADSVLTIALNHSTSHDEAGESSQKLYVFVTVTAPAPRVFELDGAGLLELGTLVSRRPMTLSVDGAGLIEASQIEAAGLAVELDGTGDISLPAVAADTLSATIDGAGNITLGGMARTATLAVNGLGHIDAGRLNVSGQTRQHVEGLGHISVKE